MSDPYRLELPDQEKIQHWVALLEAKNRQITAMENIEPAYIQLLTQKNAKIAQKDKRIADGEWEIRSLDKVFVRLQQTKEEQRQALATATSAWAEIVKRKDGEIVGLRGAVELLKDRYESPREVEKRKVAAMMVKDWRRLDNENVRMRMRIGGLEKEQQAMVEDFEQGTQALRDELKGRLERRCRQVEEKQKRIEVLEK